MDIRSGIIATVFFLVVFAYLSVRNGLRALRSARNMTFYRLRREREAGGWRMFGVALLLALAAVWLPVYGEPMIYQYFPPSPTPSLTPTKTPIPTITLTSTITLTPTITDTPVISDTPTSTTTPYLPSVIEALFQSSVTPNPDTVFSPLLFTTKGSDYPVTSPQTVFQNPVGHMYAVFSYDKMAIGSQWTALWFHEGQLVHYDPRPWDCANCSTGGSGFTDWNPSPDQWLAGAYEVQIFVGEEWKVVGRFTVRGDPPTAVPTRTPTITRTPALTRTPSPTLTASDLSVTVPPSPSPEAGTETPTVVASPTGTP